ncbi:outer membrane beta-barrel protein [Bdellovibrio sp. HCB2-146]|uniref:outer membrane beta-barrel protein n=1 Tax=Bdellovibrio sp. HCB2-146 TaxID=3394362 RepID=UPI0039BC2FFB
MKTKISSFIAVALMSSTALAQSQTSTMPMPRSYISAEGIRVGLVKPMLDMELKMSVGGESSTGKAKVDDGIGVAVGYAYLPIQDLGWSASFVHSAGKIESLNIGISRIEGNLGLAFNEYCNIKGGINLSKLSGEEVFNKMGPGFGLQAGVGVQFTKNIGLDLNYLYLNQIGNIDGVNLMSKQTGFEVGVNGTF